ncbi:hypothetical protein COV82_05140 [Candidatus Peregrinibacteria bacterium CG11_big_fil_rev_8_21_14_0_20_46_8]|nr:MAG: hypothetical protein COV82_05140 [Candidatus Peregrinibacteria bacterium CG11_big_fil_rev_8_21_14_0_20_46_8]
MSIKQKATEGATMFGEFWYFMKKYKRWWLAPIIFFLLVLGTVIFVLEGSALAPFIYTLF